MKDLVLQIFQLTKHFFNETILFLSVVFSFILSQIGYPKEIVIVITVLCVVDIFSKWYSVTVINKGKFTFIGFLLTWFKDRKLSSEKLRIGTTAKVFFYGFLLYVAFKLTLCTEDVIFANFISNVIYTSLFLTELISVGENLILCGQVQLKPFTNFFKKKQNEILDIDNDSKNK